MRTLIGEFIREILKKKDKNITDDEVFAEIKKVYNEENDKRNEPTPRYGSKMKMKKEERHNKEYKEYEEDKEAKKSKLTEEI